MNATPRIKAALYKLIEPCLQSPAKLRIETFGSESLTVFSATVADNDLGRILGKGGNNLLALKHILKAMAAGQGIACSLTVSSDDRRAPAAPRWNIIAIQQTLSEALALAGHPNTVTIAPERPGKHVVVLATSIPEELAAPLSKWLSPMGVEGQTRLILDETAASV